MEAIIIAVIIFLLGRVFNKAQKVEEPPTSPSIPPQQDKGRVQHNADRQAPILNENPRKQHQVDMQRNEFIEKKLEAEHQLKTLEQRKAGLSKTAERYKTQTKSSTPTVPSFSQNDIINGIVLSEVLGPPRSKGKRMRKF
ncbi:hypothetical protein [Bacillus sp. 2205SS5-2]|uniref:hypothetical protein n=1 Tax=Bacillus sp. 2205SS5-2 TaxID=3109031 RepID=UPI003006A868